MLKGTALSTESYDGLSCHLMKLLVLLVLCVVPVKSIATRQPAYRDYVTLIADAHGHSGSYEVVFRVASEFASDIPAEVIEKIARAPGVEIIRDVWPGRTLYVLEKGSLRSDGGDRARIERLSLLAGGNPDRSTRIEVWSAAENATSMFKGAPSAQLYRIDPLDFGQMSAAASAGHLTHEQRRAVSGYLWMARYAAQVLNEDPAGAVVEVTPSSVTLAAPSVGFEAIINPTTGEILRTTQTDKRGMSTRTTYSGLHEGRWFPARHPRQVLTETLRPAAIAGSPPEAQISELLLIDSVAVIPPLDSGEYQWESIATTALDLRTDQIIRSDGAVDEAKSDRRREVMANSSATERVTPDGRLEPVSGGHRATRWVWIISLVALGSAGILWLRRRLTV